VIQAFGPRVARPTAFGVIAVMLYQLPNAVISIRSKNGEAAKPRAYRRAPSLWAASLLNLFAKGGEPSANWHPRSVCSTRPRFNSEWHPGNSLLDSSWCLLCALKRPRVVSRHECGKQLVETSFVVVAEAGVSVCIDPLRMLPPEDFPKQFPEFRVSVDIPSITKMHRRAS
jgi:hypothetical protein